MGNSRSRGGLQITTDSTSFQIAASGTLDIIPASLTFDMVSAVKDTGSGSMDVYLNDGSDVSGSFIATATLIELFVSTNTMYTHFIETLASSVDIHRSIVTLS